MELRDSLVQNRFQPALMKRLDQTLYRRFEGIQYSLILTLVWLLQGCNHPKNLSPDDLIEAKAAFESCLICHSIQEMQRGPIIDGLPAWYSRQQLNKFLSGIRGQNPENKSELLMGSARDRFPDERTISLLSRHIESLPPKPYQPVVKGDAEKGETLYQSCIPCHGASGEGNEILKSPPLNIQEDWYLLDQLRKFASGKRGYHPEDIEGIQMAYTLIYLEGQDLKDLISYIQEFSISNSELLTLTRIPARPTSIGDRPKQIPRSKESFQSPSPP